MLGLWTLEITAIALTGSRDETVDALSNLKAAKALGLTFPPTWIVPANQVGCHSTVFPAISAHTDLIDHSEAFLALRERRYDCVLIPIRLGLQDKAADDLTVEILYDDAQIVTAWTHSKWARRRKIDLAELIDGPWVLAGPTSWSRPLTEKIFEAAGLSRPNPRIATSSPGQGSAALEHNPKWSA